jgi:hypothetical protein
MNTYSSRYWIITIKATVNKKSLESLSLLLDRALLDGFVRKYLLFEIRRSIHSAAGACATIFTKYIEKYSVIGLWNDMGWDDEWLLRFYVSVRPFYISEVAETAGSLLSTSYCPSGIR